jgi:hypothetical protein
VDDGPERRPTRAAKAVGVLLALLLSVGLSIAKTTERKEPAGFDVAQALSGEAVAAVALHVTAYSVVEPPEVPNRLQEFVITGQVTECFKGPLRVGDQVAYYAVTEGRHAVFGKDHIVFLRKGPERNDRWVPVEAMPFPPSAEMKAALHKLFGRVCRTN